MCIQLTQPHVVPGSKSRPANEYLNHLLVFQFTMTVFTAVIHPGTTNISHGIS